MNILNYYVSVVTKNYANFDGRARRSEYWSFVLVNAIISLILQQIDHEFFRAQQIGVLSGIYSLAVLLPSLAVFARRMHDIGRSGWWYLLLFTCIGIPVVLYWLCLDSNLGDNEYGPNPKGIGGNGGFGGQGWQQPNQAWQQPNQGWQQPNQEWQQPNQGWQQPQQGWQQPNQGWQQPNQGWQQPNQGWQQPQQGSNPQNPWPQQ